MLFEKIDKHNLHHAYLIEGEREEILAEVFAFIESLGIPTSGNADVSHISLDSFKIDDARNLKSYALERAVSEGKKVFVISANNFLLEAQNSLLKIFEEPIENTHFFVIIPDANVLLKTLLSRFYFISQKGDISKDVQEAEAFIQMPIRARIDFIKDFLADAEESEEDQIPTTSPRSKALGFLNTLESLLHQKMSKVTFDMELFHHIFKVREFLRQPGSFPKTLLESIALMIPEKI